MSDKSAKRSTKTSAKPVTSPSQKGQSRVIEAAALASAAAALILALALMSLEQSPFDKSVHGSDWVGPVGAFIAGFFAKGFGWVSWLVVLELGLGLRFLMRGQRPRFTSLRFAGDLVIAILSCALLQVTVPSLRAFGGLNPGGNVGTLFGELFIAAFERVGSVILCVTAIGMILIGRSNFSFVELLKKSVELSRKIGALALVVASRLKLAWLEALRLLKQDYEKAPLELSEKKESSSKDEKGSKSLRTAPSRMSDAELLSEIKGESSSDEEDMTRTPPLSFSKELRQQLASGSSEGNLPALTLPADVDERSVPSPQVLEKAKVKMRVRADSSPAREKAIEESDERTPSPENPGKNLAQPLPLRIEVKPVDASASAVDTTKNQSSGKDISSEPKSAMSVTAPAIPAASAAPASAVTPKAKAITIVDTSPQAATERTTQKSTKKSGNYVFPSTDLLEEPSEHVIQIDESKVHETAELLEKTLADYGVTGTVDEVHPGPTVTTYEFSPKAGTKVSKVAALSDDLALGLSRKVRIIAPIPGKARIGFEVPNDERVPVNLKELIEDKRFSKMAEKANLPVVVGRDIVGAPFYADLSAMPHVIVAGATGAGKSVGLNVMLSSLLFHRSPEQLRMLMIDPKVVELAPFDGIPHLLLPVVTDMKQAATALKWAVDEMERRYQAFAAAGTKNISTYNRWVEKIEAGDLPIPRSGTVTAMAPDGTEIELPAAKEGGDGDPIPEKMPFIVIVVDEFADLIMQQGKDVESAVARLAQKARAAGMHVVLATQRPSVDVITGMIKANFPTRIAFRVAQKVDSRTILDEQGAEHLLGKGDMLVKLNGTTHTTRVQCPFISEEEVEALCDHVRTQGTPEYRDDILLADEDKDVDEESDDKVDALFDEAVRIVAETGRCSTSWLQRKMGIGYNRAANMVELMEKRGMVGPPNGSKDREIYVQPI